MLALALPALGLTLVVTWPLPRCFGTCLGESEDPVVHVYLLQWMVHWLTTPGGRFLDANIFAPYHRTLALSEYMPALVPLAFPAIVATGNPIVGHNVVLVSEYTLALLGVSALAARLLGRSSAVLLAGIIYAYSPRLLHQAHNVLSLGAFWFPWLFLTLEGFLGAPTWAAAWALAGVSLGLALTSPSTFVFAAVAVVVFLGVALGSGSRTFGRRHLLRLAVASVPAAAVLLVYIMPFVQLAHEWQLGRSLDEARLYSVAPVDWLGVPPEHLLHRLLGVGHVVDINHEALFPGVSVSLLTLLGLAAVVRGRDGLRPLFTPYLAMAVATAVLAFGPTLSTGWGDLPMPYRLLHMFVPGLGAIRAPRRLAGFSALVIALLAACGAVRLLSTPSGVARRLVLAGLAAIVLLESIAMPFPGAVTQHHPRALPEAYRWLATQDPRTVALELPIEDESCIEPATYHLRRTINGCASYYPPHYFAFVATVNTLFPNAQSIALIQKAGADVLLIERRWLNSRREAALAALEPELRLEREFAEHVVYRVEHRSPPGPETLEVATYVEGPAEGGSRRAYVTLSNPGRFVPLYPLHRLRIAVTVGERPTRATGPRWLPLGMGRGSKWVERVDLPEVPGMVEVHGEVDGAGQTYRFALIPGGPTQHPLLVKGSRPAGAEPPAVRSGVVP